MTYRRVPLGELLVEAQIIDRKALEEVLERQKQDSRRLGTLLIDSGLVTETQVTQILSQQLSVPWVSLYHIDFSRQLLDLVPQHLAERYSAVPIFVRRVRGQGNTLYVAMDDPSDEAGLREIQQYSGLPVRAMIAPPSDIRAALRAYYGRGEGLTPSLMPGADPSRQSAVPPSPREPSIVPNSTGASASTPELPPQDHTGTDGSDEVSASPDPGGSERASASGSLPPVEDTPAIIEPVPDSSPHVDVRELAMPKPSQGVSRRMVTLTFLDGSQITLPARRPKGEASANGDDDADHLTARDILQALRAQLHGQDASEVLGEHGRWEALFTALLTLLLRKRLVADWEFIEVLKRL